MTWSVVRRLLAADGGFGAMNRDLGAKPDPTLGSLSAFDLVAVATDDEPVAAAADAVRAATVRIPDRSLQGRPAKGARPEAGAQPARRSRVLARVLRAARHDPEAHARNERDPAHRPRHSPPSSHRPPEGSPRSRRRVSSETGRSLDPPALVRVFETWVEGTLVQFSRESLKPTVFADLAWNGLFETLKPKLGDERARSRGRRTRVSARSRPRTRTSHTVFAISPPVRLTARHSWNDSAIAERTRWNCRNRVGTKCRKNCPNWWPVRRVSQLRPRQCESNWEKIADEAKLGGPARDQFQGQVERLRTYLGLREAGKHYLLLGYAVIRRAASNSTGASA